MVRIKQIFRPRLARSARRDNIRLSENSSGLWSCIDAGDKFFVLQEVAEDVEHLGGLYGGHNLA